MCIRDRYHQRVPAGGRGGGQERQTAIVGGDDAGLGVTGDDGAERAVRLGVHLRAHTRVRNTHVVGSSTSFPTVRRLRKSWCARCACDRGYVAPTTGRSAPLATSSNSSASAVSYTHLRAHETVLDLVCRLLL